MQIQYAVLRYNAQGRDGGLRPRRDQVGVASPGVEREQGRIYIKKGVDLRKKLFDKALVSSFKQ